VPYERKYNKSILSVEKAAVLPKDLRCDCCDERCLLSLRLQVDDKYNYKEGVQVLYVKPAMFVGDKEIMGADYLGYSIYRSVNCTTFTFTWADYAYKRALSYCRKTCKHSKMR
jgi:hypothetical protein